MWIDESTRGGHQPFKILSGGERTAAHLDGDSHNAPFLQEALCIDRLVSEHELMWRSLTDHRRTHDEQTFHTNNIIALIFLSLSGSSSTLGVRQGPPPLSTQFAEISALRDGWCGVSSQQINPTLIEQFKGILQIVIQRLSLEPPFVYPQRDGGLRAEWSVGSTEVSIDADFPQFSLYLHATDLSSPGFVERELPLRLDKEIGDLIVAFLSPHFYPPV